MKKMRLICYFYIFIISFQSFAKNPISQWLYKQSIKGTAMGLEELLEEKKSVLIKDDAFIIILEKAFENKDLENKIITELEKDVDEYLNKVEERKGFPKASLLDILEEKKGKPFRYYEANAEIKMLNEIKEAVKSYKESKTSAGGESSEKLKQVYQTIKNSFIAYIKSLLPYIKDKYDSIASDIVYFENDLPGMTWDAWPQAVIKAIRKNSKLLKSINKKNP